MHRPERSPAGSLGPDLLVGRDSAIFIKAVDGVGPGIAVPHPRRSGRHTGHPEAGKLGFFLQKLENDIARHMTFDNVLSDHAGMARVQAGRNPDSALQCVEFVIGNIVRLDFEAF